MSHCSILETKVGNESLWNPEFVVFKPRVQLSFSKKIMKSKKSLSVEMGHSRNFKSWYCNIKEMRANFN